MKSISTDVSQNIIKDITNSDLTSYQIAYKHNVSKTTVDSLGRNNLGDVIYSKKENLAYKKLIGQIQELQNKGVCITRIAGELGIYKSTMFSIINALKASSADDAVQIISVEHPEQNVQDTSDFPEETQGAEDMQALPAPPDERKYVRKPYYRNYQCRSYSNPQGTHMDFARIQINGVQLSFNPCQENIWDTVNKILTVLHS